MTEWLQKNAVRLGRGPRLRHRLVEKVTFARAEHLRVAGKDLLNERAAGARHADNKHRRADRSPSPAFDRIKPSVNKARVRSMAPSVAASL